MRNVILSILMGFLFVCPLPINAQDNLRTIQIVDRTTYVPIVDAYYQIGDQAVTSDSEGLIRFFQIGDDTLRLSHISYGDWFLSDGVLKNAIREGVIFKDKEIMTSAPITVIALRPSITGSEQFNLESQHKLVHDGGALLTQATTAISSIRKSGSYGFDPVMRGFKYDQLNIVIDGAQSAAAACPNRMDPPAAR